MINAEFSRMKRRFRFFALKMQSRLMRCRCIASGEGTWKALFVLISVLCGFDVGVGVDKIRQNSPFFVYLWRRGSRILSQR